MTNGVKRIRTDYMKIFTDILTYLGSAAVWVMLIHTVLNIISVHALGTALPLTLEMVSYYYMPAAVFLPLASTQLYDHHITVDLLYEHLPAWGQNICQLIAHSVGLIFFSVLTYASYTRAMRSYRAGDYIIGVPDLSIWPAKFLVPLGAMVMSLVLIVQIARQLRRILIQDESVLKDSGEGMGK